MHSREWRGAAHPRRIPTRAPTSARLLDKLVEVLERMVGCAFCRQPGIKSIRNSNRRSGEIFGTSLIVVIDLSIEVSSPELHSTPAASSPRVRRASFFGPPSL